MQNNIKMPYWKDVQRRIVEKEAYLTRIFVRWAENKIEQFLFLRQMTGYYYVLKISCSLPVWLGISFLLLLYQDWNNIFQLPFTFFIGFVLDFCIIDWLKRKYHRRRPVRNNDFFFARGSFPSARASRATFILHYSFISPFLPLICVPLLLVWWFLICMSRLLMKKNHLVDVIVGIVVGLIQNFILGILRFC